MGRILTSIVLSLPVGAAAQRLGTIEVAGFGRYTAMSKDRPIENALGLGGGLGFYFSNRIKLTADASYTGSDSELDGSSASYFPVHVRLAYELPLSSSLRALAGAGYVYNRYANKTTDQGLGGMLGLRLALNEQLAVFTRVTRDWMPPGMNSKTVILEHFPRNQTVVIKWGADVHNAVEAGISARFGGRPPVLIAQVEPVPVDRVESAQRQQQQQQTPPATAQPPVLLEKAADSPVAERFVTLEPVYFEFDRSDLQADVQAQLVHVAAILRANPEAVVVIEGHTDPVGSDTYNLALGDKRARTVQQFLLAQNVDANRLEVVSCGEKQLADANRNETAYARNRRVEFRLPVNTRLREPR
jgi:peptidoglycan-associated lipoprotein